MTTNQKINIGLKVINVVAEFIYKHKVGKGFKPLTKKRIENKLLNCGSNFVKKLL